MAKTVKIMMWYSDQWFQFDNLNNNQIFCRQMPFTDEQIRQAVIKLFKKYDKNGNRYIDGPEVEAVYNDLAKELKIKKAFQDEEVKKALCSLDINQDGRITLDQMFILMRKLNPSQ